MCHTANRKSILSKSCFWRNIHTSLFENLVGGTLPFPPSPPTESRRSAHYEVRLNLKIRTQLIWAPLIESCKICHEINGRFLLSEAEKIVRFTFTFTSHKCWRWQHQNLDIFDIFIFHIKCMLIDIPQC